METTFNLLKTFTEAPGPVGREHTIREIVAEHWTPLVDEIHTDALGSLIALRHGSGPPPRPSLMAAAHIDEIGLIVTGIENNFLRVQPLGGMDRRILLGLEVTVHGQRPLPGIIGSRPPHVLSAAERRKVAAWDEVFVDTGLAADELTALVTVGDSITVDRELVALKNGLAAGKALDNRASVLAVTLALDILRSRNHTWDFYAVATAQEEVGVKGAITSAYSLAPHIAIALDVTFGKQHDDDGAGTFDLGQGPTIAMGPNFHPQVVERLIAAANAEEIPYQPEPVAGGSGTDAWGIQVAREGIPTGLIEIPLRYMHQPVETASLRDIERAGRLLAGFVTRLEADFRPHWEDEL
ncbi:MAG TPA: M20/M25/M40 family metallo-hydrolase [Anaerolineae bacterium]|nr:M20/M25/M40 family metallo-hydrolase [Anaerolineae bacterium]HQH38948.1 M20/M25/M40 family metallo-hydrolase [Anaerolineae bacterium]